MNHYTPISPSGRVPVLLALAFGLGCMVTLVNPLPLIAVGDPVIVAAGDIACDPADANFNGGVGTSSTCRQGATAGLVAGQGATAVLPLGDIQYYCGGYNAFLGSYHPSWGQFLSITHPVVGNHEYLTHPSSSGVGTDCNDANAGAAGYFQYFGAAAGQPSQGYYSYDVGSWHLIALNSNCGDVGGCGATAPQGQWLSADLAAHPNQCLLAYWHIPLWSSGGRSAPNMQVATQILYTYRADLVLTGHDHIYERFAPQDPLGNPDPADGIRGFVVGTGGANHTSLATPMPNSEVRNANTFGVLKLTLQTGGATWQFVPETPGGFTDSGTIVCHSQSPSTTTPTPSPARRFFLPLVRR